MTGPSCRNRPTWPHSSAPAPYIARKRATHGPHAHEPLTSGGPDLPQERRVVTAIPGPKSAELLARKQAAVSDGIGTILPVFVKAAGGGVIVDVDDNSLIDLGAGIAVVNVGNAAPNVVAGIQEQAAAFTHTCFMVTPYEGYVAVAEQLNRHHSRRPRQEDSAVQLRCRGRRERGEDCPLRHQATSVVVFEHAYHGRTNLTMALTAKSMPYKYNFGPFAGEIYRVPLSYPVPLADRCAERRPRSTRAGHQQDRQRGRR